MGERSKSSEDNQIWFRPTYARAYIATYILTYTHIAHI